MSTLPVSRGALAKDYQPFRGNFKSNNNRHLIKTQEASISKHNRKPQVYLSKRNADLTSAITPPSASSPVHDQDTLQMSREKSDNTHEIIGLRSQNNETHPTVGDLPQIGLVRVESREDSPQDKSQKNSNSHQIWTPQSPFHISNSRWMPFPVRKTSDKSTILRRGVTPQQLNKKQMLQMRQNFNKLYNEATQNYAHSKTPLPRTEAEQIASNMSQQLKIGKAHQFTRRRNFQDRRATLDPMEKKNQGSSMESYFAISSARQESNFSSKYKPLNANKMQMHSTLKPTAFNQLMADLQVKTKLHVIDKDVASTRLRKIRPEQVNMSQLSSTNEANLDAEIGSEATPGLNARLMQSNMKDYDMTPNPPPSQGNNFGSQVQEILKMRQNFKQVKLSSQQQSRSFKLDKIKHHRPKPNLLEDKDFETDKFSFKPKIIQINKPSLDKSENKFSLMDVQPIRENLQVSGKQETQTQQTSPRNFQYSPKTSDTYSALSNKLSPTSRAAYASKRNSLSQNKGGLAGFSNVVQHFFKKDENQEHIKIQNHHLQVSSKAQSNDYQQLRQHFSRAGSKGGGYRVSQNQLSQIKESTKTKESLLEALESTDQENDGKTKILSEVSTSVKSQNDVLTLLPEPQTEQVNIMCTDADSIPLSPSLLSARINQNSMERAKELGNDKQIQMKIISRDSTEHQFAGRGISAIEYQCITNQARLPEMAQESSKPLPYAKTKCIKGRGQNAAFAWKYQNVKKPGSLERNQKRFDKIQDELQHSMRKTFQIFEKGVRQASVDPQIMRHASVDSQLSKLQILQTNRSLSTTPKQRFDYSAQLKVKEYKVPLGDLPEDHKYIEALNSLSENFSLAQIAQLSLILRQIDQLELNDSNKQAIIKEIVENSNEYTQDNIKIKKKDVSQPPSTHPLDSKLDIDEKRHFQKLKTGPLSLEKSPTSSYKQFQTFSGVEQKAINEFTSNMNVIENINNFDAATREGNSNIQSQNLKVIRAIDSLRRIAEKSMDEHNNIEIEVPQAETEGKMNESINSDHQKLKIDLKDQNASQKPFMITAISSTGKIGESTKQKFQNNMTQERSSLREIASNQKLQEFARIFQSSKLNSSTQIKDILQNMVVDRNAEILRQHYESTRAGKTYTAKRQLENSWTTRGSQRRSTESQNNQFFLQQNGEGNQFSTMNFEDHQLLSSGYDSPERNSIMEIEKPWIKVASQDISSPAPLPTEVQEDSQEISFSKPQINEANPFSNQRLQESATEQEGKRLAMLQSLVMNLDKTPKILEGKFMKPRASTKVPEVQPQRNLSNYGRQREVKPGMPDLAVESQSIAILDRSRFSLKQGTVDSLLQSSIEINQLMQNSVGPQNIQQKALLDHMNQNSAASGKFFEMNPNQKLSSTLYQQYNSGTTPPESPQHFLKTLIQDDNDTSVINSSVNITDASPQNKLQQQQTKHGQKRDPSPQEMPSRNLALNSDIQGLTQKLHSNESDHLEDQIRREQAQIELQKFEQLHKALGHSLGPTESDIDATFDGNKNENDPEINPNKSRTGSRMKAEVSILGNRQRRKVVINQNQYESNTLDPEQISKSPHRLEKQLKFEEAIARQKIADSKLSEIDSKIKKIKIPKITPVMLNEALNQQDVKKLNRMKQKPRKRALNMTQLPETQPFWPNPNNQPLPKYRRMNKESTINMIKSHNKQHATSQDKNSQENYNQDFDLFSEKSNGELFVNSQKILVTDEIHSPGIVTVLKVNQSNQQNDESLSTNYREYQQKNFQLQEQIPDYSCISAKFSAAQFEQKILQTGISFQNMVQNKKVQSQDDHSIDGTIQTLEDAENSMSEFSETPIQRSYQISQQRQRVAKQNQSPPATRQVKRSDGPSFVVSGRQIKKSPRDSRQFQQIQAKKKLKGLQHFMDSQIPPVSQEGEESPQICYGVTTMAIGKKDTNELSSRPSLKPKLQNQDIQHVNHSQPSQPSESQNDTPHLRDISLAVTERGLDITIERSGSQK